MKKLLVSMLAVSALVFTSCNKDNDGDNSGSSLNSSKLTKTIYSYVDAEDPELTETTTMNITYNPNGFASTISGSTTSTNKDQDNKLNTGTYKFEFGFEYDGDKNIISQKEYDFDEKGNKQGIPEVTTYTYNEKNQLATAISTRERPNMNDEKLLSTVTVSFIYNAKGLFTETKWSAVTKNLTTEEEETNSGSDGYKYEYDNSDRLIKRSNKYQTGTSSYLDKKSPKSSVFPSNFIEEEMIEFRIKYLIKESDYQENYSGDNFNSTYEYEFNGDLPTKSIEKKFSKNKLTGTSTTEFFY